MRDEDSEPEYVPVGSRPFLERLLDEYGLNEADIRNKIATRPRKSWIDGRAYDIEYLVHESVLRSSAEFPCAADAEALEFCREIVEVMATAHGLVRGDAIAALNRHWSDPWRRDRVPDTWIVGLNLVYHETPEYWADRILAVQRERDGEVEGLA